MSAYERCPLVEVRPYSSCLVEDRARFDTTDKRKNTATVFLSNLAMIHSHIVIPQNYQLDFL